MIHTCPFTLVIHSCLMYLCFLSVSVRLSSAERDAGQLPWEAMEGGSCAGGRAAGPQGDSPGVQHRPAGLRGRRRHAVGAQLHQREAAGARGPHRRRHPLCHRGLTHWLGSTYKVRIIVQVQYRTIFQCNFQKYKEPFCLKVCCICHTLFEFL